jgi:hypothetical protein
MIDTFIHWMEAFHTASERLKVSYFCFLFIVLLLVILITYK